MKQFLALLLVMPMLVACADDPTGSDTSHVGTYQLQTVNGDDVPASFEEDGGVLTIVAATLTLDASGTFAVAASLQFTIGGMTTPQSDTFAGTYTRSGNSFTFTYPGEDRGFDGATLSGNVLTTTGGGGEVLVFEK